MKNPMILIIFAAASALAQSTQFASVSLGNGVATGPDGSVYVTRISGTLSQNAELVRYSPDGRIVSQFLMFQSLSEMPGRLIYDDAAKYLWMLNGQGVLSAVNPSTGVKANLLNLRQLSVDAGSVFDVATGRTSPMAGVLQMSVSNFGDIAMLRRTSTFDFVVSGVSAGFPFVMRLRWANSRWTGKVLTASSVASSGPFDREKMPRGLAVNGAGLVLTTLPALLSGSITPIDHLYGFHIDFPERREGLPYRALNKVASIGMDTDGAGNFYINTGRTGAAACGTVVAHTLIVLKADMTNGSCLYSPYGNLNQSIDVASTRASGLAYMLFSGLPAPLVRFTIPAMQ